MLLNRIANYFKEWDGIDENAPKMELDINELRYIADLNIERGYYLRKCNEYNNILNSYRELVHTIKPIMEKSAEEIENLYGKETDLSVEIRNILNKMEDY